MANIPSDMIWDILLCLAVKDLLRFKCVSKFFNSLINSPDFIKLHLSHSQETKTNLYGIFQEGLFGKVEIFDITKYVKNDIVSWATVSLPVSLPRFSIRPNLSKVVGSCNGLIALLNRNSRGYDIDITIWNPFTGKFKKVGGSIPPASKLCYGFGYDPETDDYKLVKIAETLASDVYSWDYDDDFWYYQEVTYKTTVYSLKTGTWREIGKDWSLECGCDPLIDKTGVVANNALHWMTLDAPNGTEIVAFDLVKEEFYHIPTLECWKHNLLLSAMDGCLSMTSEDIKGTSVWIMKDYGVKESWTKLLYFLSELDYYPRTRPLAYSTDCAKVLLYRDTDTNLLWWYDLSTKEVEQSSFVLKDSGSNGMITFVGSLVAVNENSNAEEVDSRWKEKKRKRRGI